jgi:hypothetical protein
MDRVERCQGDPAIGWEVAKGQQYATSRIFRHLLGQYPPARDIDSSSGWSVDEQDPQPKPALPQRPDSHVLGDVAEMSVRRGFPRPWIIRRVSYDYGLDLNVELVERGEVTGINFSVQVKGVQSYVDSGSYIPVRLSTSTINYMSRCTKRRRDGAAELLDRRHNR